MRSKKAKAQRYVIYILLPIVAVLIWAWPVVLLILPLLIIPGIILIVLAAVFIPIWISNRKRRAGQIQMGSQKEWDEYNRAYREWYLRTYGPNLDAITGHDFEHFCADLLRAHGFINVNVTKASGDHGVDILAEKGGHRYAIQAKKYSGAVGNGAIQEVFTGRAFYNCTYCAVFTNSTFTKNAIEAAQRLGVGLWGRDTFESMVMKRYGQRPQYRNKLPSSNRLALPQVQPPSADVQHSNEPKPHQAQIIEPAVQRSTSPAAQAKSTFIHRDQYVHIEYLGCEERYDEQNIKFRIQNFTNTELGVNFSSLALDGINLGYTCGNGDVAPMSTGTIRYTTEEPFPTMVPRTISGKLEVVDMSESIITDLVYHVSFSNIQIT